MNYAQATALEAALLDARLAAEAYHAHIVHARDIARRAGLEETDPATGHQFGFAPMLEFLALKAANAPQLVRRAAEMFEQRLADDGDAVARANIAERAAAREKAEAEVTTAVLKTDRKRRALKSHEKHPRSRGMSTRDESADGAKRAASAIIAPND